MKNPQVININIDTVITVDADNVINDTSQVKISTTSINVDIAFLNLKTNASSSFINQTMTYNATMDVYTIPLGNPLTPGTIAYVLTLNDRRTYVGRVIENGVTYNMRPFKFDAFASDIDSFEDTWMRLAYRVNISGGTAFIEWTRDNFATIAFHAPAYEGGTGTTYATLPERVTHRGAVVAV